MGILTDKRGSMNISTGHAIGCLLTEAFMKDAEFSMHLKHDGGRARDSDLMNGRGVFKMPHFSILSEIGQLSVDHLNF